MTAALTAKEHPLKEQDAFKTYLKNNRTAQKTVDLLRQWDSTLTIKDLAKKFDTSYQHIFLFAKQYGLRYLKLRHMPWSEGPRDLTRLKSKAITILRDNGWSMDNISKVVGCSRQYAHRLKVQRLNVHERQPRSKPREN